MLIKIFNNIKKADPLDLSWKAKDFLFSMKRKLPRFTLEQEASNGVEVDLDKGDFHTFEGMLMGKGFNYQVLEE